MLTRDWIMLQRGTNHATATRARPQGPLQPQTVLRGQASQGFNRPCGSKWLTDRPAGGLATSEDGPGEQPGHARDRGDDHLGPLAHRTEPVGGGPQAAALRARPRGI